MKTTTDYLMPNDKTLVITGEYNEYCRGSRDLAIMLNMTYDEVEELLQECLRSQDESDYDAYIDNQIHNQLDDLLYEKYNY